MIVLIGELENENKILTVKVFMCSQPRHVILTLDWTQD